jgi:hypothetical protein
VLWAWGRRWVRRFVSLRPAWAMQWLWSQLELQRKTLSRKEKFVRILKDKTTLENSLAVPCKIKYTFNIYYPGIPLLDIYSREIKKSYKTSYTNIHSSIFGMYLNVHLQSNRGNLLHIYTVKNTVWLIPFILNSTTRKTDTW